MPGGATVSELERLVAERTAELAESEARYRQLIEQVDAVVWAGHPDGSAWISPTAERILGHPASVFEEPDTWKDFIAEPEPRRSEVIAALSGDVSTEVEYRLRDSRGGIRWMREQLTVMHGADGFVRRVGVTLDITAQRVAQEQFRQAVELMPDPFCVLAPIRDDAGVTVDFAFEFCNAAAGAQPASSGRRVAPGRRVSEVWPLDLTDGLFERYVAASTGTAFAGEVALQRSGGGIWIDLRLAPLPDGRVTMTWRDVTAAKSSAEHLRGSEERFRRTLEAWPDPFVILRAERDPTGRVVDFVFEALNPAALVAIGPARGPAEGRRMLQVWPENAGNGLLEQNVALLEGTGPFAAVERLLIAEGEFWVRRSGVALDAERVAVTWRVINEEREAAERVRLSEERLRGTIEGIDAVVVFAERYGGPVWFSQQAERILGRSPGDLHSLAAFETLIHPDDLPACRLAWDGPEAAWTLEYRVRRGDGTWTWIRDAGRRVPDDKGGWGRLFAVLSDVTGLREAAAEREAAVRDSEQRYRELIERGDAIAWVESASGAFEYISPQIEPILGFPPERWLEPGFWLANVRPDDRERARAATEASTGEAHEYGAIAADGREVWFLERSRTVLDDQGRLLRRIGVSFDITAQKAAEARLLESEERFRTLVAELDAVVFTVESDGRAWVSPQSLAILGQAPEALALPPSLRALVHADDRERVFAAWDDPAAERQDLEFRIVRPNGDVIWVSEHRHTIRDAAGEPVRRQGMLVDVTEQRLLRERLLRRRRAEDVGRLAAAAAHDFDNVLLGIGIHAGALARDEADPARSAELDLIIDAAERGNALVRQLLSVGRSSDRPTEPIDAIAVFRRIEPFLARLAGPGVTVRLRSDGGMARVVLDQGALEQILCNLVINARDAMPDGGLLTVEIDDAEVRVDESPDPGPRVRIAVHDTGTGMPADVAARAFEPFFTTKTEGEGSGLGLASVRHLVQAAGGEVRLHTAPAAGTTVELLLPMAPDERTG